MSILQTFDEKIVEPCSFRGYEKEEFNIPKASTDFLHMHNLKNEQGIRVLIT